MEQKEKIESKYLSTKGMLMIRIIAGAYLVYTAYTLFQGLNDNEGALYFIFLLAIKICAIVGSLLVVFSAKDIKNGKYIGGDLDANALDDEEIAEVNQVEEIERVEKTDETKDFDLNNSDENLDKNE